MKSITKKELAAEMNISMTTLRYYLNNKWYSKLSSLGYEKRNRILSPKIIETIKLFWCDIDKQRY